MDAEALLNPNALEEQLSRRLAGKSSPLPADETSDSDCETGSPAAAKGKSGGKGKPVDAAALAELLAPDAAEAAKLRAEAEAVFAKGGDEAVQAELRAEIPKTKRLESEIAQLKKKVDAAKRQQDAKALELAKMQAQKEAIHLGCRQLIAERERLEKVNAETASADEARREEVRSKFEKDVEGILAKVHEQAAQKAVLAEENAQLAKEFDELKAQFDGMMADKMAEWKERDQETATVVATLQERIAAHDKLQLECRGFEAEAASLARNIEAYTEQVAVYKSRMAEFDAALSKSAEVVQLTDRREQEYHDEIARIEKAKADDIAARKLLEEDTQKIKARVREYRRNIQALDKSKLQAEKKCRAAQEQVRKKREKAAAA